MDEFVEPIFKDVYENYKAQELKETKNHLDKLQIAIMDQLENEPSVYPFSFYSIMISEILKEELDILSNKSHNIENLEVIVASLKCLWSTFRNTEENQNIIAQNSEYMETIIKIWNHIVEMYVDQEEFSEECTGRTNDSVSLLHNVSNQCLRLFANLMSQNHSLRPHVWKYLEPHIRNMIVLPEPREAQIGCTILHNFLLDHTIKECIFKEHFSTCQECLPLFLDLYMLDSPLTVFPMFCAEILLCCENMFTAAWTTSLNRPHKLLALDVLICYIEKSRDATRKIDYAVIDCLKAEFKTSADHLFSMRPNEKSEDDPVIVSRTLTFLSAATASNNYKTHIQSDTSLLISAIYLLRYITELGDNGSNCFSRVTKVSLMPAEVDDDEGVFGFKSELIKIIGSMAFQNKHNQDIIRENHGILLLLENSQVDLKNPVIKECVTMSISYILNNNEANQKFVKSMKLIDVQQSEVMQELGIAVNIENGKPVIGQTPRT